MKVKDLIAQLQTLPANAQVMLWEGFNSELIPKIHIDVHTIERICHTLSNGAKDRSEWMDQVYSFIPNDRIERKKVVMIQAKMPAGKKVEGLR